MKFGILLLTLIMAGCGSHYVIPSSQSKPAQVYSSGYTLSGCMTNMAEEAQSTQCKLDNIKTDNSGVILEVFLFPFVKGYSCSAELIPK